MNQKRVWETKNSKEVEVAGGFCRSGRPTRLADVSAKPVQAGTHHVKACSQHAIIATFFPETPSSNDAVFLLRLPSS